MPRSILLRVAGAAACLGLAASCVALGADAGRGEAVYGEQKCSVCHSVAGKGNPRGSLDGVGAKLSADDLRQWIVNPQEMAARTGADRKPPMRGYPNLPPADLDSLVAYLQTLK
jgi:mono/diheme cytochrome c family protein